MISPPRETSSESLARWIARVAAERDCSLPPPEDGPRAQALQAVLGMIFQEFSAYREAVAVAAEAARRNGDALRGIVRSTALQGELVRTAASAVAEASTGAAGVAEAAEALQRFAVEASDAADGAAEGLTEIRTALEGLAGRLSGGRAPIGRMDTATKGVSRFLATLGRLSRQAQLLAVNAAIESAHLAEAGARFALVAMEVRKLSVSTRESSADVGRIVNELQISTGRVATAIDAAGEATTAAGHDIDLAATTLGRTQATIGDFEEKIADVTAVASQQRVALEAVASGVDEIARHAEEAAGESKRASQVDVFALFDHANEVAMRWRGNARSLAPPDSDDPFVRWIAGIVVSADRTVDPGDETIAVVGPQVVALLERADADARAILSDVIGVARAVAGNGFAWIAIERALGAVRGEIDTVRAGISQGAAAAKTAAARAGEMRAIVTSMQDAYDEALVSLDGALGRIGGIAKSVGEIDALVDAMGGAAARAHEILSLIDMLSSETDLLSLNAAIEAAHAGQAGLGFGVIAEEIRSLALSTHASTQSVGELVEQIVGISDEMRGSTGAVAGSTYSVTASADRVRAAIATLRESFAATMQRAHDVFEIAQQQARALDRVLEVIGQSAAAVDDDATRATGAGRLQLATIGSRVHAVAARRPRGLVIERVRAFSERLALDVERSMEAALASGRLTPDQLFDFTYTELTGSDIQRLARLCDVSRVPPQGFVPAKFRTPWDEAIDEPLIALFDERFDELAFCHGLTLALFDINAFVWAHPQRLIRAWTGSPEIDHRGNRVKRIFEDDYSMRFSRWGLGERVEGLGNRLSYEAFRAAGCELNRPAGERPWGAYVYARDTNEVFNEIGLPIYVQGRRHSTLRVVYGAEFL